MLLTNVNSAEMKTQLFNFNETPVRTLRQESGGLWFAAKDVCAPLGYANERQALTTHVDAEDVQKLDGLAADGKNRKINFVNESGLYALIFGSTKPEAKIFKRWVTSEVLPPTARMPCANNSFRCRRLRPTRPQSNRSMPPSAAFSPTGTSCRCALTN